MMEMKHQKGAQPLHRLVSQLVEAEVLDANGQAQAAAWIDEQPNEPTPPWYVKAFVGVSAWLAAFFIILFLSLAGWIDGGGPMMLIGGLFCAAALALKWATQRSIFGGQLAFAVSLAGQGLLIAGTGAWTESTTIAALAALALEAALFIAYPDTMHRLISVAAMGAALVVLLLEHELPGGIHLLIALFAAAAILLWRYEVQLRGSPTLAGYWAAAAYGTLLVLAALCVLPLVGFLDTTNWWLGSASLGLGLLYLWHQILGELEIPRPSAPALWLLVGVGLLLAPTYQTPGILAALVGLLLAFWRSNNLQMGLSSAFLLFFIGAYYYNLDFTLLEKSYILMGTGVALLLVRLGMMRFVNKKGLR